METTLTTAFLERWGGDSLPVDTSALELALAQAVAAGRGAWPDLDVQAEDFVVFTAERLAEEEEVVEALAKRCIEDLYLAFGCIGGDPAALKGFETHCLNAVEGAVRRIDASPAFVDEVKQVVRVGLLVPPADGQPKLASYRGVGKLRSWVQVTAVRSALELRRKSRPQDARDDEELVEAADLGDDPELKHIKELYRKEFRMAFQQALHSLESQERNVLRMYLVEGLTIDQIGAVYHVHRATAARRVASAREKLLGETRRRLVNALNLNTRQFESMMNVIRSHLDLSLDRLFRSSMAPPPRVE